MLLIKFTQPEINRINAEYEAQQRNISRLEFARTICGIYSEKSEAGQVSDGQEVC